MLWNKHDVHMSSLYFYMFHICVVLFTIPSVLSILDFILEFFKYLSRQDINDECILLAEMQHSQLHMTLYNDKINLTVVATVNVMYNY